MEASCPERNRFSFLFVHHIRLIKVVACLKEWHLCWAYVVVTSVAKYFSSLIRTEVNTFFHILCCLKVFRYKSFVYKHSKYSAQQAWSSLIVLFLILTKQKRASILHCWAAKLFYITRDTKYSIRSSLWEPTFFRIFTQASKCTSTIFLFCAMGRCSLEVFISHS